MGDDAHEAVALGEAGEDPDGLLKNRPLLRMRKKAKIMRKTSVYIRPPAICPGLFKGRIGLKLLSGI